MRFMPATACGVIGAAPVTPSAATCSPLGLEATVRVCVRGVTSRVTVREPPCESVQVKLMRHH
jgi:hypothetical protein